MKGHKRLLKGMIVGLGLMGAVLFSQATVANQYAGMQCVEARGYGSLDEGNKEFARRMAIRDALKSASLQSNVKIQTQQSIEQFQLVKESTHFTSYSKVQNFEILSEGMAYPENEYGEVKKGPKQYEVVLSACLTESQEVCENVYGNQYRPKVVVAPVVMPHPDQARDVSNLLMGYQQELMRRLDQKGYQNVVLMQEPIDLQPNIMVEPNLDRDLLAGIRDRTGAQFVLLTVIRSMSMQVDDTPINHVKRFYNFTVKPNQRFIEADWYLIDLIDFTVAKRQRGGFDIKGDVLVGRDKPFGTSAFFNTDTGLAFHALLQQQVNDVVADVGCQQFVTQVIDVRNGEYILFLSKDAGAKVGDDLAVYHRNDMPVRFNGVNLGDDFEPGAFLRIKRISAQFAVAEVLANKKGQRIEIGDIVKAW